MKESADSNVDAGENVDDNKGGDNEADSKYDVVDDWHADKFSSGDNRGDVSTDEESEKSKDEKSDVENTNDGMLKEDDDVDGTASDIDGICSDIDFDDTDRGEIEVVGEESDKNSVGVDDGVDEPEELECIDDKDDVGERDDADATNFEGKK